MIPEELRNFIEQNCSGKEPSDLIMEAIGKKIEQLGADADEVLAFVEECTKGLTLEQKAEAEKKEQELLEFLKYELEYYCKSLRYAPNDPKMLFYSGFRESSKESYTLFSKFYRHGRERYNGKMSGYIDIDLIKREAEKYKDDNEIISLLKKVRKTEAKVLYYGAMDNINKEFANKTFDVKCLDQARKALILIQNNYSDIEEISIPDLEMFIEKANNTYLTEEIAKKQREEQERQRKEQERQRMEQRMEQRRQEREERKRREELEKENKSSFFNKLKKILFN